MPTTREIRERRKAMALDPVYQSPPEHLTLFTLYPERGRGPPERGTSRRLMDHLGPFGDQLEAHYGLSEDEWRMVIDSPRGDWPCVLALTANRAIASALRGPDGAAHLTTILRYGLWSPSLSKVIASPSEAEREAFYDRTSATRLPRWWMSHARKHLLN